MDNGGTIVWQQGSRVDLGPLLIESKGTPAFSPDGRCVATSVVGEGVCIWDVRLGKLLFRLKDFGSTAHNITYAPDGLTIAIGCDDGSLRLYDARSGELKQTLQGHTGRVLSVAYASDGKRLASGGHDGTLRIWNARNCEQLLVIKVGAPVTSVAFTADGQTVAGSCFCVGTLFWEPADGGRKFLIPEWGRFLQKAVLSPNGKRIATLSDSLRIWDADTLHKFWLLKNHRELIVGSALSPDGRTLATASLDGTVGVWNMDDGDLRHGLRGHADAVLHVTFSRDSQRLVSCSVDNTARLWDAAKGTQLQVLEGIRARSCKHALHPTTRSWPRVRKTQPSGSGQQIRARF